MPFKFNGVDVEALQFNGVAVETLQLNGVEIWTSAPAVVFNPISYSAYPYSDVNISLNMNATTFIVDETDGNEVTGSWLGKPLSLNKQYSITITNQSTDNQTIRVDSPIAGFPITDIPVGQSRTISFTANNITQFVRITPISGIVGRVVMDVNVNGGKSGQFTFIAK